MTKVSYGQLERLLKVEFPDDTGFRKLGGKTYMIAIIRPCRTTGDARSARVEYRRDDAPYATDMANISSLVGQVKREQVWGIIDRGDETAPISFEI